MSNEQIELSCFQDLLDACYMQEQPQRLLFVFTKAQMPENPTEDQKNNVQAGLGGCLVPWLCVDKLPNEITDFGMIVKESVRTGEDWDIVFVSSIAGNGGYPPNEDEATQPLQLMVAAVREGAVDNFASFNKSGAAVNFVKS